MLHSLIEIKPNESLCIRRIYYHVSVIVCRKSKNRISVLVLIAPRSSIILSSQNITFHCIGSHRIVSRRIAKRSREEQSEPVHERERERERAALGTGSFCFSMTGSRDAFGSRFDHIKRQMSFYGGHCHPWIACRERRENHESPVVSYTRTFLVADAGDALLSSSPPLPHQPVRRRAFD